MLPVNAKQQLTDIINCTTDSSLKFFATTTKYRLPAKETLITDLPSEIIQDEILSKLSSRDRGKLAQASRFFRYAQLSFQDSQIEHLLRIHFPESTQYLGKSYIEHLRQAWHNQLRYLSKCLNAILKSGNKGLKLVMAINEGDITALISYDSHGLKSSLIEDLLTLVREVYRLEKFKITDCYLIVFKRIYHASKNVKEFLAKKIQKHLSDTDLSYQDYKALLDILLATGYVVDCHHTEGDKIILRPITEAKQERLLQHQKRNLLFWSNDDKGLLEYYQQCHQLIDLKIRAELRYALNYQSIAGVNFLLDILIEPSIPNRPSLLSEETASLFIATYNPVLIRMILDQVLIDKIHIPEKLYSEFVKVAVDLEDASLLMEIYQAYEKTLTKALPLFWIETALVMASAVNDKTAIAFFTGFLRSGTAIPLKIKEAEHYAAEGNTAKAKQCLLLAISFYRHQRLQEPEARDFYLYLGGYKKNEKLMAVNQLETCIITNRPLPKLKQDTLMLLDNGRTKAILQACEKLQQAEELTLPMCP